jgi:hypothetical protein
LTHGFSRASPDSPTSGIRAVVRLGGGAGVDPDIGSTYRMWELTLGGRMLGFKCEWLSPTSTMYGKNVGFIREVTH